MSYMKTTLRVFRINFNGIDLRHWENCIPHLILFC